MICPICDMSELVAETEPNKIEKNGHIYSLVLKFHVCSYCGVEMALTEDTKHNATCMRNAVIKELYGID